MNPLPKTGIGAACVQWVTCGKSSCRCMRGERHQAHYLFWREGGRLRKRYIPPAELDAVRAACAARRARQAEARQQLQAGRQAWRALAGQLREVTSDV